MSNMISKLKREAEDTLALAGVKSKNVLVIAKLRRQIEVLEARRREHLAELGAHFWRAHSNDTLADASVKGILNAVCDAITSLDHEKDAMENEILALRQAELEMQQRSQRATCPCGNSLEPHTLFCSNCGRAAKRETQGESLLAETSRDHATVCLCGSRIYEGAMFCGNCGNRINAETSNRESSPTLGSNKEDRQSATGSDETAFTMAHAGYPHIATCDCGASNEAGSAFCGGCGMRIRDSADKELQLPALPPPSVAADDSLTHPVEPDQVDDAISHAEMGNGKPYGVSLGFACVCGAENEAGSAFCGTCGARIEERAPVKEPLPAAQAVTETQGSFDEPSGLTASLQHGGSTSAGTGRLPDNGALVGTCGCGVLLEEDVVFCGNCGAPKSGRNLISEPGEEPEGIVTSGDGTYSGSGGETASRPCCACGEQLDPEDVFCCSCGAKQTQVSAAQTSEPECKSTCKCGAEIETGILFCGSCGMRVST